MFTLNVCSQHFVKNNQNLVAYSKNYNHSTKYVDQLMFCFKMIMPIENTTEFDLVSLCS